MIYSSAMDGVGLEQLITLILELVWASAELSGIHIFEVNQLSLHSVNIQSANR